MPPITEILSRYRVAALALSVSAMLHAAVFVGLPERIEAIDEAAVVSYSASLDPAALIAAADAPVAAAPAPAARPARSAARPQRARPRPETPPAIEAPPAIVAEPPKDATIAAEKPAAAKTEDPAPEVVALAAPAAPVPALEPPRFPVEALPASISITYQLTSAFADGRATYNWNRDGDSYRITGEAEAVGFFTLFLEGRLLQESRGTVTAEGLRPERFREKRPSGADEGLQFDWARRSVTFDKGDEKRTTPLTDNTVDWLSMIFQLAHMPPKGESLEMQVFTQRRMYKFRLVVLGEETIDIPIGRVRALHLRHVDPADSREVVDVWLGVDQHYLPVKMRYPVARNRLMVEQSATRVSD